MKKEGRIFYIGTKSKARETLGQRAEGVEIIPNIAEAMKTFEVCHPFEVRMILVDSAAPPGEGISACMPQSGAELAIHLGYYMGCSTTLVIGGQEPLKGQQSPAIYRVYVPSLLNRLLGGSKI